MNDIAAVPSLVEEEAPLPDLTPEGIKDTAELVALMVTYVNSDECSGNWGRVAEKMGWSTEQVESFRATNAYLFNLAQQAIFTKHAPILPPSDVAVPNAPNESALTVTPSQQQIAETVAYADTQLQKGLKALGLNESEVGIAQSLQAFNKDHFKESMDMISSGVLVTALKLQGQQREIEERLKHVRAQISAMNEAGPFVSKDRGCWTKEEQLLMIQLVEVGKLLNDIQETWYKGAAYLAVIRARMRGDKMASVNLDRRTQRTNKPGFRPTVIINQEPEA